MGKSLLDRSEDELRKQILWLKTLVPKTPMQEFIIGMNITMYERELKERKAKETA